MFNVDTKKKNFFLKFVVKSEKQNYVQIYMSYFTESSSQNLTKIKILDS